MTFTQPVFLSNRFLRNHLYREDFHNLFLWLISKSQICQSSFRVVINFATNLKTTKTSKSGRFQGHLQTKNKKSTLLRAKTTTGSFDSILKIIFCGVVIKSKRFQKRVIKIIKFEFSKCYNCFSTKKIWRTGLCCEKAHKLFLRINLRMGWVVFEKSLSFRKRVRNSKTWLFLRPFFL